MLQSVEKAVATLSTSILLDACLAFGQGAPSAVLHALTMPAPSYDHVLTVLLWYSSAIGVTDVPGCRLR